MGAWLSNLIFVGASLLALYAIQKYLEYKRAVQPLGSYPHFFTVFSQISIISNLFPQVRGLTRGMNAYWMDKYKPYSNLGFDATATIFPTTGVNVILADAAVIKEVTTARARFPKPVKLYEVLSFFGDNIVASEGEEWKKFRKIAAPAFNDKNNKLVWNETERIIGDLFDVWGPQDSVVVDHAVNITLPISLFALSAAAFGKKISWKDDGSIPPNHEMTFKGAIHEVSKNSFVRFFVPEWAMGMTAYTRKIRLASEELDRYMLELIWNRRNAQKEEKHDLLSNLLEASYGDPSFTDRDLTGNIFVFLIAGHESTAHTLCFAFALLALYPDQQEILFRHIKSVLPDGRPPTYEEMPLLTHSMAVLYETVRMYPPVTDIPKYSAEDTSLTISNPAGEKRILPIPRGTRITINIAGLHYNPRYWKDPEEFRPARFLEPDWPRDAFIPFSAGPRACIGRKVLYETVRMYPPVTDIPKYSAEDTSLTISNPAGEKRILPIPRGTRITINIAGLHYNPRYWKDPEEFRPARFLEPDWPRDAFIPFSAGPRACIGRKFSETESIAVLTMFISRYKIEVKEEPQYARETFEERKARVLAWRPGLTMTPLRVPLVFKRR
ncbi:hypothetical protein GYMLUDRAFT_245592 [Collybiopsis luxurians FD-317 M1]|uniref:Cytochrome P450 n=1 Tax=Collybiopsis luxurians FD-317 M1 TaxID=944289 RepID=A0A0D0BUL1_9AGAR|nr:hypothetical protein GYMLUDRAFT_245592 [Collybiopsis luxurians FD-317 M1]